MIPLFAQRGKCLRRIQPWKMTRQVITIRGPEGEVRRFALARGVEVQYVRRHIVLRPGESTTVRLTPVP